jgi:hypothetical protein
VAYGDRVHHDGGGDYVHHVNLNHRHRHSLPLQQRQAFLQQPSWRSIYVREAVQQHLLLERLELGLQQTSLRST